METDRRQKPSKSLTRKQLEEIDAIALAIWELAGCQISSNGGMCRMCRETLVELSRQLIRVYDAS